MMFVKLYKVLLPTPSYIFQNYVMKSTSKSNGFVLTIKKTNKKIVKRRLNEINKDLFGSVLDTATKRKRKKYATDSHQEYVDLSYLSFTPSDYGNPGAIVDEINQVENKSNLNQKNVGSSLMNNENKQLSNDFLIFNEKKCNNQYPQNETIFNARDGEYKGLPSVSKVLQETMPLERKLILKKWEESMIEKLGEEGFQIYKQDMFDRGKLFHSFVEQSLQNKIQDDFQRLEQYIKSVKSVLQDINGVKLLESRVIHPLLQYYGYVDCVGLYRGNPVVIDFKTSAKSKSTLTSTYDSPLQVVAYLGAMNYDPSYDIMPNLSSALLVIAYETGMPADVHQMSKEKCLEYWNTWCKRLQEFKNKNSNVISE